MTVRFLLTLVWLLLPSLSAGAQPGIMIDTQNVVVCPVAERASVPPEFSAPTCQTMNFWSIDTQQSSLWLKASVQVSAQLSNQAEPHGLFVSGKASSEVWFNGEWIGRNGQPGSSANSEQPGRMDVVIPVPRRLIRPGPNEVVLHMSGHHGFLDLDNPLHGIFLGTYADPVNQTLASYWPSLITFGVLLLGVFYFGVSSLRGRDRAGSALLCLLSLFAVGQLLAEVARGLYAYSYPVHDLRLVLIVMFSLSFGLCLTALVCVRFDLPRLTPGLLAVAAASLIAVVFTASYDGKALVAMQIPMICCTLACVYWVKQKKPSAASYLAALLLFSAVLLVFRSQFLDVVFFHSMALFLVFLFSQQALSLAAEQRLSTRLHIRTQRLQDALDMARERAEPQQIRVKSAGEIELVSTDRITHFNGAGDYVELNLEDGRQTLHNGSLNELEETLPASFLRVHRSHIVNSAFIRSLTRESSGLGELHLSTGKSVPVSRRILPTVRQALD